MVLRGGVREQQGKNGLLNQGNIATCSSVPHTACRPPGRYEQGHLANAVSMRPPCAACSCRHPILQTLCNECNQRHPGARDLTQEHCCSPPATRAHIKSPAKHAGPPHSRAPTCSPL